MYKYTKPLIDLIIAVFVLTILSPVFFLLVFILVFVNKGKPFFSQKRPGFRNRIFKIIKFKTMNDAKDENGSLISSKQRITKVGAFLRKTSLDELPQLINVIKGDLSLVGPRPLRIEYLPLYDAEQARRHNVKPGITGWAQINGRNTISWEEKFKLDVWYVDNVSFTLDLKILYLTLIKVIKRSDIERDKENIIPPFKEVKLNG